MKINASRKLLAAVTAIGLISAAVGAAEASGGPDLTRSRVAPRGRGARAPVSYGVAIQAVYDEHGNPSLVANFSPDGALAKPRWSICAPPNTNVCTPAKSTSQFLTPGPTPAGTVFEATASYNGNTYVARSAVWLGAVQAVTPPTLDGVPRSGTRVAPHGASWTGGWQTDPTFKASDGLGSGGRGPDFDYLSVEACRTTDPNNCVNLSAPAASGFSKRPPVVGNWFTGWYLFAIDQRFAYDTAFAVPGYITPAAVPPVKLGATAAHSAPLGPVVGPPAPKVTILRDAIVRRGRVLVARLRCSVRCRAWLQVDARRAGSAAHVALIGSALVGVPRRQLRRGPLDVQIYVDDGPLVHGNSQLR